jgi:hypothetical protein
MAERAFAHFLAILRDNPPRPPTLAQDKDRLLVSYDFPA